MAFLWFDTAGRVQHLNELRAFGDIHVKAPAVDAGSATGYAGGERELILPNGTIDSYHEIMQAQLALARGGKDGVDPRVRSVDYDNAPEGREVHWAWPMRGWLTTLARIRALSTTRPLGAAVEDAALLANPILLGIFLLTAVPWTIRRWGAVAGALLAVAALCSYPFYTNFKAGNAEHQGLAALMAFLTVAPLLSGRLRPARPSDDADLNRRSGARDAIDLNLRTPNKGDHRQAGLAAASAPHLHPAQIGRRRICWERHRYLASAVAGGIGLWISAASEAPVLLAIGLAVCLAPRRAGLSNEALLEPKPKASGATFGRPDPTRRSGAAAAAEPLDQPRDKKPQSLSKSAEPREEAKRKSVDLPRRNELADDYPLSPLPPPWRVWALTGAAVSFLAYLFEYFPSYLGWRLEVNHPLYALAWAAGGEVLRWRAVPSERGRADRFALIASIAALVACAVIFLATHRSTFLISDPFLWHLHSDYIEEFQSVPWYWARHAYSLASVGAALPLLVSLIALAFALRRATPHAVRADLILALGPALLSGALAVTQIRWLGLATGLSVVAVFPLLAALAEDADSNGLGLPGPPGRPERAVGSTWAWAWRIACFLLFVPGAVSAARLAAEHRAFTQEEMRGLAERDFAHWLRARMWEQTRGNVRKPVVLSSPNLTTDLIFHGGVRGLGTLYWENLAGLRKAAAIYDAPTAESAHELIRAAGITHIVTASWDPFMGAYLRLDRGLPPAAVPAAPYFAACLIGQAPLPAWLRPVKFDLPAHPALARDSITVFEVVE